MSARGLTDGHELVALLDALGAQRVSLGEGADEAARVLGGAGLPEDERRVIADACAAVLGGGAPRAVEHRFVGSDGVEHWRRSAIVRTAPSLLVAASLDVTAARQTERQFKSLESWVATFGEALPFDFWICDRDGRCVLQNPASVETMGNAVGLTAGELSLPAGEREARHRAFERASAGLTHREPFELGAKSLIRVATPIRSGEGVLIVDLDVSELRQTEERLRELLRELADAQNALLRKNKLAALGEMASALAHEVRNPLGAISNVAALFRKQGAAEPLCDVLDEEVSRLDALVAALLHFAEPREANAHPTPVAELVRECVNEVLQAEPAGAKVGLHFELGEAVPDVLASQPRLRLAISHVLRNAVQAMPAGGELRVHVGRAGSFVEVTVRDSGPGISADVRTRLFEPFVTGRSVGSGLGLSIARRVLEEHRGELSVASEPGSGASFVLRLPV